MATEQALLPSPAAGFSLRPLLLLLGIAGAVAIGVAVMLWWQGPNWSLLYGNLEANDASQVMQALQAQGIQYKLNDASGAVMVPADKVHEARLQLAGQGLPRAGGNAIDLINKDSGLGVSQFMENARYQSALETELARTISSVHNVMAARVHLALTQQSAFVRDRHPVSASVLLQLRAGGRLEPEQVQAIVHLVASSIPDLAADNVTIVDQQGRLLSAPGSAQSTIQTEQFAAASRIEETYAQRIEQLLAPVMGIGRVRAQVTVDLDANENEQTHEQYKPDSAVVRSEQTSEQVSPVGGTASGGVPGALTNQPPVGGTVAGAAQNGNANAPAGTTTPAARAAGAAGAPGAAAAGTAAAALPENVSKAATRNFEIDRTLSYTRQPGGRIKRLTVAVLLDNPTQTGADGKATAAPLSTAQIDDITKLVKGAVGFDEARGDSVSVVNAAFKDQHEELKPEAVPIWQRPMVQDIARLVLGALVLLVIALGVLRPLIRNLTTASLSVAALPAGAGGGQEGGGEGAQAMAAVPAAPLAYEQQIAQAKTMVAQDPKRVAQVVKNWVGE
jgi:flagellar M-ring protein FliF